jgi:hypothetical protein
MLKRCITDARDSGDDVAYPPIGAVCSAHSQTPVVNVISTAYDPIAQAVLHRTVENVFKGGATNFDAPHATVAAVEISVVFSPDEASCATEIGDIVRRIPKGLPRAWTESQWSCAEPKRVLT